MKQRLYSLLLAILAFGTWVQAQTYNVAISGVVTELGSGNPIANHDVYIYFDSTSHVYYNVVQTDVNGYYMDSIYGLANSPVNAWVYVYDCNGTYVGSSTLTFTPSQTHAQNTDFQICNTQQTGQCQASFNATHLGGTTMWSFTDLSTAGAPLLSVTSWFWDFGDGNTSTQQNPTHAYNALGPWRVCLTITTSTGCTSTHCDSVSVGGGGISCAAWFAYSNQGCNYVFYDSSFSQNQITSLAWDFGDGTTGTGSNPSHTYTSSGSYTVCLIMTDSQGCTDTFCDVVSANCGGGGGGCQASYYWYPDTSGQYTIIVVNTSTGTNLSYFWDFGDGTSSTQQNPSHVYNGPSTYRVCLTVTETNPALNCTSTFCDSLIVLNRMSVPFSINVISGTLGTSQPVAPEMGMELAPNPARNQVAVRYEAAEAGDAQIELTDVQGRRVFAQPLGWTAAGAHETLLSLNELPRGMYLVQVTVGNQCQVKKLMLAE